MIEVGLSSFSNVETYLVALYISNDEEAYTRAMRIINSPKGNAEIVEDFSDWFDFMGTVVTGDSVTSKLGHYVLLSFMKSVKWSEIVIYMSEQ